MAVLIIGAGLVGSQLARVLAEQGERPILMDRAFQPKALAQIVDLTKVTLVEGDVLHAAALAAAIREHHVNEVVHLAANPMLTIGAQKDPRAAIELNIMGTVNVLEAAREHRLKRVVVASSNVLNHHIEGGGDGGDPMCEEAFPRPISIYSSCKQAVENIGLNYGRWFGVDFAALRYGAVAGPWSGAGGGGPSNLFLQIVRNAAAGHSAVVPATTMEWVYSKDAARGTLLALRAPTLSTGIFNITMGQLTSPEQLCAAVRRVLPDSRLQIEHVEGNPALKTTTRAANTRRAKEVLGYIPQFQMPDAVRDLVDWLRNNEEGL
jgi:nucleoside-diphosphate-sugar epimerase